MSPTYPKASFQKTNFKGYFSQSQTSKCLMRFFGSGTGPWAQISWEGTIFDAKHDDWQFFPIFENFGKSRNKVWVPPVLGSQNVKFWNSSIADFGKFLHFKILLNRKMIQNTICYVPLREITWIKLQFKSRYTIWL